MWIEMLQVLADVRCSLRLEKCKFAEKSIVWCGTELSEGGLAMPPSRTRALLELGEPECKKDMQRLLGLAEAYRSAVPRLEEFMKPVRDCATRSKGKIKITPELSYISHRLYDWSVRITCCHWKKRGDFSTDKKCIEVFAEPDA